MQLELLLNVSFNFSTVDPGVQAQQSRDKQMHRRFGECPAATFGHRKNFRQLLDPAAGTAGPVHRQHGPRIGVQGDLQ